MQQTTSSTSIAITSLPNAQAVAVAFDPMEMMERLAGGADITNSDLSHLRKAAKTWKESNGDISMERCLQLPNTPEKYRISERNRWLCEAIKLLPEYRLSEKSNQAVIDRLESEWNNFVSRGMWRTCRDDAEPPSDASALFVVCFLPPQKIGVRPYRPNKSKDTLDTFFTGSVHNKLG